MSKPLSQLHYDVLARCKTGVEAQRNLHGSSEWAAFRTLRKRRLIREISAGKYVLSAKGQAALKEKA